MVSSDVWDEATASVYDADAADMFARDVVDPAVDLLATLAGDGRALELAIGTGRIGIPLLRRGVRVTGIELSVAMVERLRAKVGADELPVVVGDMASTRVPGEFTVVYLVFNTITNLRTQAEQVACFRNAAAHWCRAADSSSRCTCRRYDGCPRPGGSPVRRVRGAHRLRHVRPRDAAEPVAPLHEAGRRHDALRRRQLPLRVAGRARPHGSARPGMELERRTEDWAGTPFTSESETHVSVWRTAT